MDSELKCNRLTCRQALTDKAVVTTCSHIFCVGCANELFNASRLCPACETTLSEPDDVVVCSLHPTNDYKTSVLSGLSPAVILEICSRAISFWHYQTHQEHSFQQAVIRNLNDKNTQLQKQLDNVVREANGEINILNNKIAELERDLEVERRKVRELQDGSRERDKEYQKLKAQLDKIKRKALLVPNAVNRDAALTFGGNKLDRHPPDDQLSKARTLGTNMGNTVNLGSVIGSMEANGIQRTPIVHRTGPGTFGTAQHTGRPQNQQFQALQQGQGHSRSKTQRQPFQQMDRSYRSGTISDRSLESANEVENLLMNSNPISNRTGNVGWITNEQQRARTMQRAPPSRRTSGVFHPQIGNR